MVTGYQTPPTGDLEPGRTFIRQPRNTADWQLLCDQLFTWPADQPRHATPTPPNPVETDRPQNESNPTRRRDRTTHPKFRWRAGTAPPQAKRTGWVLNYRVRDRTEQRGIFFRFGQSSPRSR